MTQSHSEPTLPSRDEREEALKPVGPALIQKRTPGTALREKLCATCGKPFQVTPDQKFFDCPDCYRKTHPIHKAKHRGEAQVLVQIQCAECGTREYLDFPPADPKSALCRACFARARRNQKSRVQHPESR